MIMTVDGSCSVKGIPSLIHLVACACTVPILDAESVTRCFSAGLGGSPVLVDHSTEDAMTPDRGVEQGHRGGVVQWWALVEVLVRTVVVEVLGELVEDGAGVSLVVDQQSVGAFVADAANEPFGVAVRSGCPGRDLDHIDAFGGEDGIEGGGELGVPVADQEAEGGDPLAEVHQEVAGGLGGPGCARVGGHAEEVESSGADFHDEQDIESAQGDGVEGEEVGGQQSGGLGVQEGPPVGVWTAWCGAEVGGGEDSADGACAQVMSEPGEFGLDASVSPGWILLRQTQHEVTDLIADRWAAGAVRVGPFFRDQAAVPGQ
jgi:hypothetical protein